MVVDGFEKPGSIEELVAGLEVLGCMSSRHLSDLLKVVEPTFFDMMRVYNEAWNRNDDSHLSMQANYDAALRTMRFMQELRNTWRRREQADILDHQEG